MKLAGGEGTVLTVTLGWRENALREPLRWIANLQSPLFARVRLEEKRDRVKAMHYSFAGNQSLAQVLASPLEPYRYQLMLTALAEAEAQCAQSSYPDYILADPRWVFLSDGGVPCFAYAPIDGRGARVHVGLRNLLKALSDKRVQFVNPDEEWQRAALTEHVATLKADISFSQFAEFLRDDMGFNLQSATRKTLTELERRAAERKRAREYDQEISTGEQGASTGSQLTNEEPGSDASWRGVVRRGDYQSFIRGDGGNGYMSNASDGTHDSHEFHQDVLPLALLRISTGEMLSVPADGGSLGRSSNTTVRILGNPKIGREHAMIRREKDKIVVQDLGSQNGTWFQGKPLQGKQVVRVGVGQVFSVADEQLRVVRSDVFHAD